MNHQGSAATVLKGRTILIIPDKFKGTITAAAAAAAIARGWRKARPSDRLDVIPMSDGGDGFGEVLGSLRKATLQKARIMDAAGRQCSVPWWWVSSEKTAIVESARAIGLAMLPAGKFHPFQLDTFGLGQLLQDVALRGAARCVVGIGGSATNDGGFGMARALGWEFLDNTGTQIVRWIDLHRLTAIRAPRGRKPFRRVVAAVDVANPLLGMKGATRVYGPQKGLRPGDLALAERCLRRLAIVVGEKLGKDFSRQPGAGAAGGLGFALSAFLGAEFETGFDLFARHAKLRQRLKAADLVITGEGAIDASTLMGKGVGRVATLCREAEVPCLGLAGAVTENGQKSRLFAQTMALTDLTSVANAKESAGIWLQRLAERAAKAAFSERLEPPFGN